MRGRSFCSVFRISFFGIDGEYVSGIRLRRMEDPFVRAAVINGGTIARVPWDMIATHIHGPGWIGLTPIPQKINIEDIPRT